MQLSGKLWLSSLVIAVCVPALAQAQTLPQNASLTYLGTVGLTATMNFNRTPTTYNIDTEFKIPLYNMQFHAKGRINNQQLYPESYRDVRYGLPYAQADFDYDQQTIAFGKTGEPKTTAMQGIPMDLFSLAWHIAGHDGQLNGITQLTNGKKVHTSATTIRALGSKTIKFKQQALDVNVYRVIRGGDIMEYGLAPSMGNIPAVIRYTDDGKTYQLSLTSAIIDGKTY